MKISIKAIRKVFTDCSFNPNIPGPIKPIIDVDNFNYYRDRAVEMIHTSKASDNPKQHLQSAIQVLALAIIKYDNDKQ